MGTAARLPGPYLAIFRNSLGKMRATSKAIADYPEEAAIIGRILLGFGDLA
jgi:hypothetical protein